VCAIFAPILLETAESSRRPTDRPTDVTIVVFDRRGSGVRGRNVRFFFWVLFPSTTLPFGTRSVSSPSTPISFRSNRSRWDFGFLDLDERSGGGGGEMTSSVRPVGPFAREAEPNVKKAGKKEA